MGRSVKRSVRVILRTHFLRTDGKPSWIAGEPSVVLGDRRIGVEAAVQRCQQIDHVVCHGARDVRLMAAKRRGFCCDHIFEQMDRRKGSPVVG